MFLEIENHLGWETCHQMVNSSDMNPVKNELTVSNFSVYGNFLGKKTLLNSHWSENHNKVSVTMVGPFTLLE